ncbi:SDR family oxidoreductase [Haloferula rosea]|uniref:SDR family oxidoreductase n=2 Tax=Haloferula rosea TaxID=490093 RepID=A0A934RAD4_9BACT|nr:SDR family oxidoreductase [Haloferula rosea]
MGLETVRRLKAAEVPMMAAARTPGPLEELGIPTQAFDAGQGVNLDLPERLSGCVYFPGSINLKPFHRFEPADFLSEIQTNLIGAVSVLQAAMPSLKASESASVVLFSTVAVAQGMPFHTSVAAAKGAVEGFARALAAEWAPKVRVNVIAPSLTDTPLAGSLLSSDAKREASAKRHPSQSIGSPTDVAALVEFLLSDASKFITGQVIRPDGGLSSLRTF